MKTLALLLLLAGTAVAQHAYGPVVLGGASTYVGMPQGYEPKLGAEFGAGLEYTESWSAYELIGDLMYVRRSFPFHTEQWDLTDRIDYAMLRAKAAANSVSLNLVAGYPLRARATAPNGGDVTIDRDPFVAIGLGVNPVLSRFEHAALRADVSVDYSLTPMIGGRTNSLAVSLGLAYLFDMQ